jgi:hypothetical protein
MSIDLLPTVARVIGAVHADDTIDGREMWPLLASEAFRANREDDFRPQRFSRACMVLSGYKPEAPASGFAPRGLPRVRRKARRLPVWGLILPRGPFVAARRRAGRGRRASLAIRAELPLNMYAHRFGPLHIVRPRDRRPCPTIPKSSPNEGSWPA